MYIGFLGACQFFLTKINESIAIPSLILFLGVGVLLTLKTSFLQIWGIKRAFRLLMYGDLDRINLNANTLSPVKALFSAMAATVGMGNIVGPPMAIALGGPGALFWMLIYIFFGTATKCIEVTFAVYARSISKEGNVIGGPSQYLRLISPLLGTWYALLTMILFGAWSCIQINTLSCIWAQEGIPNWISGLVGTSILLFVVLGGVQRIGNIASTLVPLKFGLYIFFALLILGYHYNLLLNAIFLIFECVFTRPAMCGGLAGAGTLIALRHGVYKSIFITEAGLGTASIAHALTDAKKPIDQGVLAIFSGVADLILCTISGLLTIVTNVWTTSELSNTLIYQVFKHYSPFPYTQYIFLVAILLFVITALIGNTYNGGQSFASLVGYKYVPIYYVIVAFISFLGAFASVPLIWNLLDLMLVFVAVPNLLGVMLLAYRYTHVITDQHK